MGKLEKEIGEYNKMLLRHIEKKDRVKLVRKFRSGDESIFGYLLGISECMLLMQMETEFDLNGYKVLPIWAFDALRFNKWDKATTRIMNEEGFVPGIDYEVDITNWQTVFNRLKQLDKHVSVACENNKDEPFYIGAIERVGKKSVRIRNYDPAGVIDEEASSVKYEDITTLSFDDRYSTIFRKYLREKKTKETKTTKKKGKKIK